MSLTLPDLCRELLDSLEAFDRETLPLGLYACEEYGMTDRPFPRLYNEWTRCVAPCLERFGCHPFLPSKPRSSNVLEGQFSFVLPGGRDGRMEMARTSKIRVQKFGSAYRIDAHAKYGERWAELRLDRRITDLWKPSLQVKEANRVGMRLFLFLGFAREPEPFGKELATLSEKLEWDRHGVEYQTRTWPDREERAFHVRVCAWAALPSSDSSVQLR